MKPMAISDPRSAHRGAAAAAAAGPREWRGPERVATRAAVTSSRVGGTNAAVGAARVSFARGCVVATEVQPSCTLVLLVPACYCNTVSHKQRTRAQMRRLARSVHHWTDDLVLKPRRKPRPRPTSRITAAVYVAGVGGLCLALADEHLELRQWRQETQRVMASPQPVDVVIRSRVRASEHESGQGCVDWPAGRALLQWALDGGLPESGATVLEIGAGVGLTSIGIASAARQRAASDECKGSTPNTVVAADVCDAALANLHFNSLANLGSAPSAPRDAVTAHDPTATSASAAPNDASYGGGALRVLRWDAAGGASALSRLPVDVSRLTHVIGADLVSLPYQQLPSAGGEDTGVADADRGLEATLAALLEANPRLEIALFLTDRTQGGAVGALAAVAGQPVGGPGMPSGDPSLRRFERRCEQLGLTLERLPVPDSVVARVTAAQTPYTRACWWLADTWDGLWLYKVRRRGRAPDTAPLNKCDTRGGT